MKLLKKYDVVEKTRPSGGGHRTLVRVIDGKKVPCTIPYHRNSEMISLHIVKSVRRRFQLTAKDGVTDEEFYSKKRSAH